MATYTLRNLVNATIYFPDIGLEIGPLEDLDVSDFNREQLSLSPTVQACVTANECVLVLSDNTQLSEADTVRAFQNYLGNPVEIYYDQDEMDYLMVGDAQPESVSDYFDIPSSPPMKTASEEWPGLLPLLRTKFDSTNLNFDKVAGLSERFTKTGQFKNRYLEMEVSIPTSEVPYVVLKDTQLTGISAVNGNAITFYIEIFKNGVLLDTFNWGIIDDPLKEGLTHNFTKGDEIILFCGSVGQSNNVVSQLLFEPVLEVL